MGMRRGDMVYVFDTVHDWRRAVTYAYAEPHDRGRIEVPIRTPGLIIDTRRTCRGGEELAWCKILFPQGVGWVLKEWLRSCHDER